MEIEKKKSRPSKRVYHGPIIRYHSMSMPLIEELPAAGQPSSSSSSAHTLNTKAAALKTTRSSTAAAARPLDLNESGIVKMEEDDDDTADDEEGSDPKAPGTDATSSRSDRRPRGPIGPRCERTFITFENDLDERAFAAHFPTAAARPRRPRGNTVCPITRLPARYFDPITQLPYRNMQAFKILREAYYQQLEERANADNPEVQRWLTWRRRVKEQRINNKLLKSSASARVAGI